MGVAVREVKLMLKLALQDILRPHSTERSSHPHTLPCIERREVYTKIQALNLERLLRLSFGRSLCFSLIPLHTLLSHSLRLSLKFRQTHTLTHTLVHSKSEWTGGTHTYAHTCIWEFALNELKFVKVKQVLVVEEGDYWLSSCTLHW